MQALAREHDAGLHHFLVELAHRGQQFRARHYAGFGVLVGFHNHHETHRQAPFDPVWPVPNRPSSIRRARFYGTDMSDRIISQVIAGGIARSRKCRPAWTGRSSTPRPFGSITDASDYWIARSSRAMTTECAAIASLLAMTVLQF